jgi:hypothetical protein
MSRPPAKVVEGDEVRFLDEKGEGIVTGFDRNGNALVQTADGFVIPYLPSKLVVVGSREFMPKAEAPVQSAVSTEALSLGITLLNRDSIQISLINGLREHFLIIVYALEEKNYRLIGQYTLKPLQACAAASLPYSGITQIDRFYIRVVPLPQQAAFLPGVWSGFIRHQSPLLADPNQWPWDHTGSYRMLQFAFYPDQSAAPLIPDKDTSQQTTKSAAEQRNRLLQAGREDIYEVDLHLEELLDSTAGMDHFEMITYQLRHFEKCLDEAIERKIWKFVAIHGVGKGRLREEIRKILKNRSIAFQDASYAKYGYGATEVRLKG